MKSHNRMYSILIYPVLDLLFPAFDFEHTTIYTVNLSLDSNFLTGQIPGSLGTIFSLQQLRLNNNLLEGVIPTSLSALSSLGTYFPPVIVVLSETSCIGMCIPHSMVY
jgi:hypothetical protein